MTIIRYQNAEIAVADGQSLLEALVNGGCHVPHSCNAGACQSCLMRCIDGQVPEDAQLGLKETLRAQGYFLACKCQPQQDMQVSLPTTDGMRQAVMVSRHQRLTGDVVRIRLRLDEPFNYYPGQYITLWKNDKLGRSYSLVSVPFHDGDELEIHVQHMPHGRMSGWLYDELEVGAKLNIQGPAGDCFYTPGFPDQKMLLMATGTGIAPLYGIARDALLRGHQGEIHLFHGATDEQGLYLQQSLQQLAAQHHNLSYHGATINPSADPHIHHGAVDQLALQTLGELQDWRIFLCGAEAFVNKNRKACFLAGASLSDIFADAFVLNKSQSAA